MQEKDIKDTKEFIETVEVEPTTDDELVEGSEPEKEGDENSSTEDEKATQSESEDKQTDTADDSDDSSGTPPQEDIEPKPVEGETPKERALRLETERLRNLLQDKKSKDLFTDEQPPIENKPKSSSRKDELAKKYNPEDLEKFREVLEAYSEDFGFVKKDEFIKTTYEGTANAVLKDFLKEHPEYTAEKDQDGVLWTRFKQEFQLYKKPVDPYDHRKIFERIHKELFNIQSGGNDLKKIKAQQEKIKSASHAGRTPGKGTQQVVRRPSSANANDMRQYLKGFTKEEADELLGDL